MQLKFDFSYSPRYGCDSIRRDDHIPPRDLKNLFRQLRRAFGSHIRFSLLLYVHHALPDDGVLLPQIYLNGEAVRRGRPRKLEYGKIGLGAAARYEEKRVRARL